MTILTNEDIIRFAEDTADNANINYRETTGVVIVLHGPEGAYIYKAGKEITKEQQEQANRQMNDYRDNKSQPTSATMH